MIERVSGVLLDTDEARYLLDALDTLLLGRTPTARLNVFIERLRRSTGKLAIAQENTPPSARKVDVQQDSSHIALYDLVGSREAARILGCTQANVRDLARRGSLPRHRAGRGWVYPAASVVALAEKRAAKRG